LLAQPTFAAWVDSVRAQLEEGGAASITFRTSGSAGSPKRCTHPLATLWQEIDALADALAPLLPGRRRILSAVASHHIYGFLFTALLPQRLGIDTVVDLRGAGPAALAGLARPGDLIVAYPLWWEAAARLEPAFAADIVGVTSTAPCPDALADRLAAAGLRLLQMYGSSETGGVGWRTAAGAPFSLLPHWSRGPDEDGLLRALPNGRVEAAPLQDRLAWSGPRSFTPAGRIDAAVQVGGVNVFPAYVADVVRSHPQVADAAVRLMRPDEGGRLKAFVVARAGADLDALQAALPAWLAERLSTPERPAAYTFGDAVPRQRTGKLADWIIDAV
jgi:4-coumarate--CoA ligase (photoactive yellow protein activation family)